MLKFKELIYLYRLAPWGNKLRSFRMLGYTILGYLMSGSFNLFAILINTLAVFGVLLFGFLINDYYDYKIQKEINFIGFKIKDGSLKKREFFLYLLIPLFLVFPIFFISRFISVSKIFLISIFAGLFLIVFYSIPPLRLKERKIAGFLVSPFAVSFLFLESFSLLKQPGLEIYLFAIIIFLFQCYLETLHSIKDFQDPNEITKVCLKDSLKLLRIFSLASFLASLLLSFVNRFFIITAPFSLLRFKALDNIKLDTVQKTRANVFSPVLSLYEFGFYGLLGLLNIF